MATGIFKHPIAGRIALRRHNLDGDGQADLSVHGGAHKAVYVYPSEHYPAWRRELADMELPWGMFGENFTTEGVSEDTAYIGDRWRVGSAEVQVTEPRMPCYKLGVRFGRDDIVKRFLGSGRTGLYLAVVREGDVGAGDTIERLSRSPHGLTVADITRVYVLDKGDLDTLRRLIQLEELSDVWRRYFEQELEKHGG